MESSIANRRFSLIREVSANYRKTGIHRFKISGPEDAARMVAQVLPDNSREHFITLHLDAAHQVIAYSVTATGTATSCPVHPREVFQIAFLVGAVAVIVGHNHPSGEAAPSAEDETATRKLTEAGDFLCMKVLDHVIVADGHFYSFTSRTKAAWTPTPN